MWNVEKSPCAIPCSKCERKGCGEYHSQCEAYLKYKEDMETYRAYMHRDDEINGRRRAKKYGYTRILDPNSPVRRRSRYD